VTTPASPPVTEPARVEAIALAIVESSPLDALERIYGPALTALAKAVLDPDRYDTDTEMGDHMDDDLTVTVTIPDALARAFVEWCFDTQYHNGTEWEPLVELLNSAPND
jgi:hypothetical protein